MLLHRHLLSPNATTGFQWCRGITEGPVIWACFAAVFCLCGFPACVAVIWEQLKRHRSGAPFTPNDVFMLNITVTDLVFFAFQPPAVVNIFMEFSLTFHKVMRYVYALALTAQPLLMACICLDCYVAVVHPLVYRARKSLTPRVVAASVVWLVTLSYGAVFVVYFMYLTNSPMFSWPYVVALPVIAFCDFSILCALRRPDPAAAAGGRDLHPQKKRAHQIIVNSLVMSVVVYLPPMMFPLMTLIPLSEQVFMCQVFTTISIFPSLGCALLPILHLGNLGKITVIV